MTTSLLEKSPINYKNWMIVRVLTRDKITGEAPETGTALTGTLIISLTNLFDAIFHGYSPVASYDIVPLPYQNDNLVATALTKVQKK